MTDGETVISLYIKAKVDEILRKTEELSREIFNPIFKEEDDPGSKPGPSLAAFMDYSKCTTIWLNYGVIRRVMIAGLVKFYAHLGMDFTAPLGTKLWAPAKSVVVQVRRSTRKGWGNFITLKIIEGYHQGLYYRFCHCQDIKDLKKGDIVEAGEVVAWVGNTGNSTAPHVHFMCGYLSLKWCGYFDSPKEANVQGTSDPISILDLRGVKHEIAA